MNVEIENQFVPEPVRFSRDALVANMMEAIVNNAPVGTLALVPAWSTIATECMQIMAMLFEKNMRYGNSALDPIRVFSRASAVEQILVRLDDKLSRLRSGAAGEDEDVVADMIGYLVLLRIARKKAASK